MAHKPFDDSDSNHVWSARITCWSLALGTVIILIAGARQAFFG